MLKRFRQDKKGSAFAIIVFLLFMVFLPFVWFFLFSSDGIVTMVSESMSGVVEDYGTDQHELYAGTLAFVTGIQTWILIIALLGVFVAGIVYTMKKKAEDGIY